MNTCEVLRKQLQQDPDDDTLAGAYRDALEEFMDYRADEALEMVVSFRTSIISARRLAQATNLFKPAEPSARYLRSLILRVCRRKVMRNALIVLVADSIPPTPKLPTDYTVGPGYRAGSITVGAQWVLDQWKARERELERRKERDRLKRLTH